MEGETKDLGMVKENWSPLMRGCERIQVTFDVIVVIDWGRGYERNQATLNVIWGD